MHTVMWHVYTVKSLGAQRTHSDVACVYCEVPQSSEDTRTVMWRVCTVKSLRAWRMHTVVWHVYTVNYLVQDSEFKPHIVIKGRTVKVHMPYYVCIFIKNFGRIQQNPLKPFTFGGVAAGKVSEWMGIGIARSLTYMCCH